MERGMEGWSMNTIPKAVGGGRVVVSLFGFFGWFANKEDISFCIFVSFSQAIDWR